MKKFECSWKCFATSLLIFTLLCITMVMVAGLVIIPVMYISEWEYDYDQVSKEVGDYPKTAFWQHVKLAFCVQQWLGSMCTSLIETIHAFS